MTQQMNDTLYLVLTAAPHSGYFTPARLREMATQFADPPADKSLSEDDVE